MLALGQFADGLAAGAFLAVATSALSCQLQAWSDGAGLAIEDCNKRRGVNDHFGRSLSS